MTKISTAFANLLPWSYPAFQDCFTSEILVPNTLPSKHILPSSSFFYSLCTIGIFQPQALPWLFPLLVVLFPQTPAELLSPSLSLCSGAAFSVGLSLNTLLKYQSTLWHTLFHSPVLFFSIAIMSEPKYKFLEGRNFFFCSPL